MDRERFLETYNSLVHQTEVMCSIARDTRLQVAALETIHAFTPELAVEKSAAIATGDEDYANLLLGLECCLVSLYSEIEMTVLLKSCEPEKAWDKLIDAQEACAAATRAHSSLAELKHRFAHLLTLERHVFPPQGFVSTGFICGESTCSICGEIYGSCSHLSGMPYMGQFCRRRLSSPEVDHVSFVDVPEDKRCRITHFAIEAGYRNKMTWLVEPDETSSIADDPDHLRTIKMIHYVSE